MREYIAGFQHSPPSLVVGNITCLKCGLYYTIRSRHKLESAKTQKILQDLPRKFKSVFKPLHKTFHLQFRQVVDSPIVRQSNKPPTRLMKIGIPLYPPCIVFHRNCIKNFDKDKKKRIFTQKKGWHDSHRPTHPYCLKIDLYPITKI